MSAERGTLFAGQFRHPVLEHDGEVVQRRFAVANRQCPPFRRLADRHVHQLQRRLLGGINLAVACELADHAVDRAGSRLDSD